MFFLNLVLMFLFGIFIAWMSQELCVEGDGFCALLGIAGFSGWTIGVMRGAELCGASLLYLVFSGASAVALIFSLIFIKPKEDA